MEISTQPLEVQTRPKSRNAYVFPLILVTSLFFFWGFVHNLDPVLIPHLRKAFSLNDLQSSLIDFSVFIAYFAMALPAGFIMRKYGYKSGIIIGLLLFGIGSFLFIPAANTMQYPFFLAALFIIACGLTFLETAANPYVTILGPSETATQRLNFSQSFNGLAAFLAPVLGGSFILSGKEVDQSQLSAQELQAYLTQDAASVKMPYALLGGIILSVTILFIFTKLPDIKHEDEGDDNSTIAHALKHIHLRWAVVAQFFYVGAQVCVLSFFIRFITVSAHLNEKTAAIYSGVAGLAFMIGRFAGTYFMRYVQPNKLLMIYSGINIALSLAAIFASGMVTVYALIGMAFFMSIMFPTIFSLGIADLGKDTKIASSLIVMSIVGGAFLPLLLGYISDATQNIQYGYIVPLVCFIVVMYFGWKKWKPENAI